MRWQGQQVGAVDADALPGLESLGGLVRSVTTPEFAGVTFHEVLAKSALNRVPGPSAMPFDWTVNPYRGCTHACVYCVSPDTLVLMADGRHKRIADVLVGEEIIGTERIGQYRRYVRTTVEAKWPTRRRAYRVTLADGTEIVSSADHRFLTDRGWKHVIGATAGAARRPSLTTTNRLMGFGMVGAHVDGEFDREFRTGYLAGMIRGDGMIFHRAYRDAARTRDMHMFRLALADTEALDRSREFLLAEGIDTFTRPFATGSGRRPMTAIHTAKRRDVDRIEDLIALPGDPTPSWRAGFLSGFFDAEGSCSRGVLRMSNKQDDLISAVTAALRSFDIPHTVEPARDNGVRSVRVTGGLPERQRFFLLTRPAITRKLDVVGAAVKSVADLRVVSIADLGHVIDMVDITTGTGDFIANGVISHNCFARRTHEYLDFDSGRDFDSEIVVKTNVAEVLARELARPGWQREHVALGTNTDPYQRAEGRYRLMPGIIDALASSGTPFSVLTKGTLLRRDLPALEAAASVVDVDLSMSIAITHDALRDSLEPGAPSFRARIETIRAASEAGFRPTVFLMPILPHLTDDVAVIDDALRRLKDAGTHRVVYGALHLRPGAKEWFWQWLERERPDLLPRYRGLYPGASVSAPVGYRKLLAARVRPLLRRHGLTGSAEDEAPVRPSRPMPVRATAAAPAMLF